MEEHNNYRLHQAYDHLLFQWKDRIRSLEESYSTHESSLTKPFQTQINIKMENLKSYYYSFKYYATAYDHETQIRFKDFLTEMKKLENEINRLLNERGK